MSAQDMLDMLGLTEADRQPATKKRKTDLKTPVEKGLAREVMALMGERAPPVSMIQMQPKYKQKPRRSQKATPWINAPFENQARDDGLMLHHWTRKKLNISKPTAAVVGSDDEDDEPAPAVQPPQEEYKFAKYDVQIEVPTYTQKIYDAQLTDEDWTKEETDYLVETVKAYSQKWPVIVDRYEYTSSDPDNPTKSRTMEDLKTRYYTVNSKMLAHRIPIESMNRQQYSMYECMRDFDGERETTRKALIEQHLHKTEQEVNEETALLMELQRIMISQQKLEAERKELRDRLDYPEATGMAGAQYASSQGLTRLFQDLLQADRLKKDRRLKEHPGTANSATTTANAHRDSIAGASAVSQKGRGRESLGSSALDDLRASRPLSPRSSQKYFVTTHDKISSGVSFASDKLSKSRVAKSAVQTERIGTILNQLKIPEVIAIPTQPVIEAFEGVMGKVHELLEMRKLAEKEDAEIKVLTAAKQMRGEGGGDEKKEETANGQTDEKKDEAADSAAVTPRDASRRQKRSASVLSSTSNAAVASVKRRK